MKFEFLELTITFKINMFGYQIAGRGAEEGELLQKYF